jgi:hypothetical protein
MRKRGLCLRGIQEQARLASVLCQGYFSDTATATAYTQTWTNFAHPICNVAHASIHCPHRLLADLAPAVGTTTRFSRASAMLPSNFQPPWNFPRRSTSTLRAPVGGEFRVSFVLLRVILPAKTCLCQASRRRAT